MKVLLRHKSTGFYFAGWDWWVSNPERALDLETIEGAAQASRQTGFGAMEIVASPGDPECELVLPCARSEPRPLQFVTTGALFPKLRLGDLLRDLASARSKPPP